MARIGGDEFVILLNDLRNKIDVSMVSRKIIERFSSPFMLNDQEYFISTSIGASIYPGDGEDALTLLKNADSAMYKAKAAGRNNFQLYSPAMNEQASEQLMLETELRRALEREELRLYFQPQVSLVTGEIVGMEALLRWERPGQGIVPPNRFLPLAEESGLILPIGERVMETAARQNKAWQDEGLPPIQMAVNIAHRQFQQQDLTRLVGKVLCDTGLEPRWLELELTEGIFVTDTDKAVRIIGELKNIGVKLSIDDFGTGYSSLSYLKRFAVDTLKIDRSFIMGIPQDEDDVAITLAIISMAQSLRLSLVAEGVETPAQMDFLRQAGCTSMQGYLFSRPVPAEEMGAMR